MNEPCPARCGRALNPRSPDPAAITRGPGGLTRPAFRLTCRQPPVIAESGDPFGALRVIVAVARWTAGALFGSTTSWTA